MNKLGTELANAWMKKTLVDLNGFSENEIQKIEMKHTKL